MGFNQIFYSLSFTGMLSLWPDDALFPSLVSRKVLQPERPEAAFGLQRQPLGFESKVHLNLHQFMLDIIRYMSQNKYLVVGIAAF
jgi:hypothetical protein